MEPRSAAHPPRSVQRDLVVIGASAGGVDSLQTLVAGLPAEFPAAVLIVLHVPATGTSVLPQILARHGPLPAEFARDETVLERGQIYVAPADHHLLTRDGRVRLTQGPRENGHRPAVDPLFRSAGRDAGPRAIGLIMSGLLDDGAFGLRFLKQHGGAAVVQDPADAAFPSMPQAAMDATEVDAVAPAAELAATLCGLIDATLVPEQLRVDPPPKDYEQVNGFDRVELTDPADTARLIGGPPTALTCPECGGALWEREEGGQIRFACHVGHAYSLANLAEEQGRDFEATLWSALRSLEERADVNRRLGRRVGGGRGAVYEDRAQEAESHARSLREILGAAGRLTAPASEDS